MGDKTEHRRIPPAPPLQRRPPTQREAVYLAVLVHWYRHRKRAPRLSDLSDLTRPHRSIPAIRAALISLEGKGYVRRNDDGRFEVIE